MLAASEECRTQSLGLNRCFPYNFFEYYTSVFKEGALTAREKALIALAVAHTEQCPYCIDAYTSDTLQRGVTREEMMEAVHVGAAIKSGATLVSSVMMMNKVNKLDG